MNNFAKARVPSKEREEKIINKFTEHLRQSDLARQSVVDMALRAHRQYCCIDDRPNKTGGEKKKSAYLINVFDPHFFATTTSSVAAMTSAVLGSERFVGTAPRGATPSYISDYFEAAIDYHWKENPQARTSIVHTILSSVIYGTAFGVCFWNTEHRKVPSIIKKSETISMPFIDVNGQMRRQDIVNETQEYGVELKKVKDSPWYRHLDFFSCFPDCDVETVREGRFFIYRERRPLSYIKAKGAGRQWSRRAVREIIADPGRYEQSMIIGNYDVMGNRIGYGDEIRDEQDPLLDVFEYYVPDGRYTIVGGRKIVAYTEGHIGGYYPIVHIKNHPVPGEFWGMSSYQIVESGLVALQNMHSAQVTESVLNAFPPLVVSDPSVNLTEFTYRPGAIIRTNSMDSNAVRQLNMNPTGIQVSQALSADLRSRIDVALGSSDVSRGTLPTRNQSATAVMQSSQNNQLRQGPLVVSLEDDLVRQIGENFRDLILCCQSDDLTLRIKGGSEVITMKAELLSSDIDLAIVPVTGAQRANEVAVKRLIDVATLAANYAVPVDVKEIIKIVLDATVPQYSARVILDEEKALQQAMQQRLLNETSGRLAPQDNMAEGAPPATGETGDDSAVTEMSREMGQEVA